MKSGKVIPKLTSLAENSSDLIGDAFSIDEWIFAKNTKKELEEAVAAVEIK